MTWPFQDPPNTAVFTTRSVIERKKPICFVYHDRDDGAWQFHDENGAPSAISEARIVGLGEIIPFDPSLSQLFDLPRGWYASKKADGSWARHKNSPK